jgi:hypothetical protein
MQGPYKATIVGTIGILLALTLSVFAQQRENLVRVLPAELTLHGPESRHALLLEMQLSGPYLGEGEDATFTSSDEQVAVVEDGVVRPIANGTATISATSSQGTAEAHVTVTGMDQPHQWSFREHVLPVLTKVGCNSGACHGALAGKGGFKLSLRGYDPPRDHFMITRHAGGRRVEFGDPGRSLFLAKPSGAVPHKGGLRFETDSPEYRILSEWIASGAPAPAEDDPRALRLEVLPDAVVLASGGKQRLLVRAHYSDGHIRDVTRWARFESTNAAVATVDESGRTEVIGHGEGAITASFDSHVAVATITSPYPQELADNAFDDFAPRNFIDELVAAELKRLNLPPSPLASDASFIRRAHLDAIGMLPAADEVRAFLADTSPEKRARLIDDLLARPEFVDYWTYKWSDVLLINGRLLRPDAVKAYYAWLRGHVEKNTPWDELARELVTSKGGSTSDGATNFFALHQDPETMSENVSKAFMGLSIGCAKCHNHPLEKWTNDQYYAMANLFARVKAKGWGGDPRSGDGKRTLVVSMRGELVQPRTGKAQPPTPLDGEPLTPDDPRDRREYLADWLTSPENPYFARAITNRVWANFLGVGLVEPVDDLRVSNPASNEKLLSAAADYLAEHEFDLKALMRVIMQSATYQRSSEPSPGNVDDQRFYSRYYPRRLMAEVLLDAVSQVTGVPTEFKEIAFPGADFQATDFYPEGTRAIELYDSAVRSYFLKTFGRNDREITCECERSNEPSMVQVLHLANGDTLLEKLSAEKSRPAALAASGSPDYRVIEEVYLAALARYPTDAEMKALLDVLAATPPDDRQAAIEDLYWSVLSSREFLFQH